MARKRKAPEPWRDKPLYKNVMAVLALVAAASGLIGGAYNLLTKKAPEVVHDNTELIVDRSQAMHEPWEKTTRLDAAQSAGKAVVATIAEGENLALRQFGGPCQDSNTDLVVPFAQHNAKRVQTRLASLTAAGKAPLNRAINEAIGDFGDQKHFEGANRRILVITGSDDTCQEPELREAIRDKLAADASGAYKIRLDFRFIGIGLRPEQQRNLSELAKIAGGRAVFADHPEEVEPLLRSEVHATTSQEQPQPSSGLGGRSSQPAPTGDAAGRGSQSSDVQAPPATAQPTEGEKATVRRDTKEMVNTLAAGVDHLNDALASIQKGDFEAARHATDAGRAAAANSQGLIPLDASGRGQFPALRAASGKCFELYKKLLDRASEMISFYEKKDFDSYQRSAGEFERLAKEFNRTKQQVTDLLAHM
ncbi:MAG TPA: vWA domain-containing protein [Verrucomicrobiae bacterium]|nr:vWA domain-containing protein [Verrucomicrobiae bacterium]